MAQLGCWRFLVYGRVQAVGYRDWVVGVARQREVDGWVRNVDDGTVEIVVRGEGTKVDELERLCGTGPALARVFWLDRMSIESPLQVMPGSGFHRLASVRRRDIR